MDRIQILAIVASALLLLAVFELVRRRRLDETYAFIWITFAVVLIALALRPHIMDAAARWLGVYYPPILLVLVLIVMVYAASLWFATIVSRQRKQIERLIEDTAVIEAELRELRASRDTQHVKR